MLNFSFFQPYLEKWFCLRHSICLGKNVWAQDQALYFWKFRGKFFKPSSNSSHIPSFESAFPILISYQIFILSHSKTFNFFSLRHNFLAQSGKFFFTYSANSLLDYLNPNCFWFLAEISPRIGFLHRFPLIFSSKVYQDHWSELFLQKEVGRNT